MAGIEFDIAWHTLLVESAGNQALLRTWSMAGLSNLIWSFEFELYPLDDVAFKSWVLRHCRVSWTCCGAATRTPARRPSALTFSSRWTTWTTSTADDVDD